MAQRSDRIVEQCVSGRQLDGKVVAAAKLTLPAGSMHYLAFASSAASGALSPPMMVACQPSACEVSAQVALTLSSALTPELRLVSLNLFSLFFPAFLSPRIWSPQGFVSDGVRTHNLVICILHVKNTSSEHLVR